MSISVGMKRKLCELTDAGLLYHLPSLLPGIGIARTMYVSHVIHPDVCPPWGNDADGFRMSQLRQTLDVFSEGQTISVSERPFAKDSNTMLARVDPVRHEVWDIRCLAPRPQIRCFGRFAGKDTFVALSWADRDELDWQDEIENCLSEWTRLFFPSSPFRGASLDDYITNFFVA